jgi:hypothetical protein
MRIRFSVHTAASASKAFSVGAALMSLVDGQQTVSERFCDPLHTLLAILMPIIQYAKFGRVLHRAAECRDLARIRASPSHRAELEKMALTWENLAEH